MSDTVKEWLDDYENLRNFEVIEVDGGVVFQKKLNFDLALTPYQPPKDMEGDGVLRFKVET